MLRIIVITSKLRNPCFASAALLLAACGSDDPGATASQQDHDQVAQSLAANTSAAGELAALGVASYLATGLIPEGLSLEVSGRFFGRHGGLVYDGTIRCTELGLEVPTPCGPMTATATVTGTWTGHLQVPRLTLTLTRTGTWTMSGLQAATMEVEGRSHADLMSRFASASDQNHKELALASDATYQAITVDRASRWPISGDIHYAITGERTHTTPGLDTSRTFSVDALLTFHPDHTATLVLDGDVRYELDLEAGTASPEHD